MVKQVMRGITVVVAALALLVGSADLATACPAGTCTKVIDNGPDAGKKVAVIMGDGYTAGQQGTYNNQVDQMIVDGMFGNDFFLENRNAFNVYRLNLASNQSGVSQKTYDLQGTPNDKTDDTSSTTMRDTALRYIFSGTWEYCWLEHSWVGGINQTELLKNAALAANGLSHADYIFVIMNEGGGGGCNRGPRDIVQTTGVGWQVVAHEAGHGIGGLRDEYQDGNRVDYEGGSINNSNCSTKLDKGDVFWRRFIHPSTPVPTMYNAGTMSTNRTVGMFEGCNTWQKKIWRPTNNCRMNGNTNNFCPVCQMFLRKNIEPGMSHYLYWPIVGDFDGDGLDEILYHFGEDLALYRAVGAGTTSDPYRLEFVWAADNEVPAMSGGTYFWQISGGDRYHVADFDGDGKDDIYVVNDKDWQDGPWIGMFRSTGSGFEVVRHWGGVLPTWGSLSSKDVVMPADFDGDGKKDLYLYNPKKGETQSAYLGMFRSTGTNLQAKVVYIGKVPAAEGAQTTSPPAPQKASSSRTLQQKDLSAKSLTQSRTIQKAIEPQIANKLKLVLKADWLLRPYDRFTVADFDGDGKEDLYVFNGSAQWPTPYLGMIHSKGASLETVHRYKTGLGTGWRFDHADRQFAADTNDDGKMELYLAQTMSQVVRLAITKSTGDGLELVKAYDNYDIDGMPAPNVPGWSLRRGDRFYPEDVNGDGQTDLVVHTWAKPYRLGVIFGNGNNVGGSETLLGVGNSISSFSFGGADKVFPVKYESSPGTRGLFISPGPGMGDRIALIRRSGSNYVLDRVYHHWITNAFYDSKPAWSTLP